MQPGCFISRRAWEKCGPLNEDLHFAMDFDLWLQIAKGFNIEKVDEILATARIHEDAKTQMNRSQMYVEIWLTQIHHGYERYAIPRMSEWLADYFRLKKRFDRGGIMRRMFRTVRARLLVTARTTPMKRRIRRLMLRGQ